MIKWIAFVIASLGILIGSWDSFHRPLSHGFFRFFAFESLLILILSNLDDWFDDPFSPLHLISWLFLLSSILLAGTSFALLKIFGRPEGQIELTTRLVQEGTYRYLRHPLYSSLLLLGVGTFLKRVDVTGSSLLIGEIAFLITTARIEEEENVRKFGQTYLDYMHRTKMFIPFLV